MTAGDIVATTPLGGEREKRLLAAITDYAIFMLNPDGTVATWPAGGLRVTGHDGPDIVGRNFSILFSPQDRDAGLPAALLRDALQAGHFEGEARYWRADGTPFAAHVGIDPMRDAAGGVAGFAVVMRDLTRHRQAERALRRSEEQFRLLVQGVTDYAIFMLDREGFVTNWNLGAQRIKGYAPDEIVGQHFSRFYTEEDRAAGEPQRSLQTAVREGRFEAEGWRVRKDGSRFRAHVVLDTIRDDAGTLLGFAKITRDVSERMQSQQALEQAREELFQSQKLEAIGQLTGGVAHDFNNLLMAVLGSLELARRRTADPSIVPLLDNAIQGAQRGASLTQRMLAFARRQTLNSEPVDLPVLVHGMADMLQRTIGPAIIVETRFPAGLPRALTDPNQLEAAILNLAVNARDAMPAGGPLIISAREEMVGSGAGLAAGRYIRLSVVDRGEGMDADTLAHATNPFFTTKGVGKGTGLGLSMVQGLTEQSGGRLSITSRAGEGTTVDLWLPVAGDLPVAAPDAGHDEPLAEAEDRALVVVAVDDDALVLMNTALLLEDLGHRVIEANSGRDALDILAHEPRVDLVVTDHAMPHMTGSQLAQHIREQWPDMPVVLATGYAELPPGGDTGLPRLNKPFSQDQLARVIGQASAQAAARAARRRAEQDLAS